MSNGTVFTTQPPQVTVAKTLVARYPFKTVSKMIYVYNDKGLYVSAEDFIEKQAQRMLGDMASTYRISEVAKWIARETQVSGEEFDKDLNTINALNGLVDMKTQKLSCHTPDYSSLIQLPVTYEPNANCTTIRKFLNEVLKPEDIQVIEELFGYCLLRSYPIQKAFLFVGEGSNGKSTLIELLRRLLGKNNCSCLTFQEIEEDRFAREELFMKLANLSADIPSKAMHHVGLFKMLTGGDQISADRKFRSRIKFVNFAKLVFSTNRPPKVYNEDSYAFWRRWVVIDFPNQFTDNADKHLLTKLTNQEEMSGLLNVALRGLRRLLENGDLSYSTSPDEIAEHYNMLADPVLSFVNERCDLNGESTIEKDILYEAFVEFCNERHVSLISKESFGRNLRNSPTLHIGMTRLRENGHRPYAWKGISLKKG